MFIEYPVHTWCIQFRRWMVAARRLRERRLWFRAGYSERARDGEKYVVGERTQR